MRTLTGEGDWRRVVATALMMVAAVAFCGAVIWGIIWGIIWGVCEICEVML